MNKEETYKFLNEHGINYEVTEHKAVLNIEELQEVELPYPEWDAKNLFVRDDKKRNYYLITVKGDKRVALKFIKTPIGNINIPTVKLWSCTPLLSTPMLKVAVSAPDLLNFTENMPLTTAVCP